MGQLNPSLPTRLFSALLHQQCNGESTTSATSGIRCFLPLRQQSSPIPSPRPLCSHHLHSSDPLHHRTVAVPNLHSQPRSSTLNQRKFSQNSFRSPLQHGLSPVKPSKEACEDFLPSSQGQPLSLRCPIQQNPPASGSLADLLQLQTLAVVR